jgi:hypothetical protein
MLRTKASRARHSDDSRNPLMGGGSWGMIVTPHPWWIRAVAGMMATQSVTGVLDSDCRRNDVTVKLKCVTSVNH